MKEIVNFEEASRKRIISRLMGEVESMYRQAREVADEYYQLMLENPEEAIQKLIKQEVQLKDMTLWLAVQITIGLVICLIF